MHKDAFIIINDVAKYAKVFVPVCLIISSKARSLNLEPNLGA